MKHLVTILITLSTFTLPAQAPVINRNIEIIEPFHSVNVNARYNVHIKQSNEIKLEVRALKEILDVTTFEVKEGVLGVDVKRDKKDKSIWEQIDNIKIAPKLDLYISMKEVKALSLNGNGRLITENSIASEDLTLNVSGSGTLEADIKGKDLILSLSGGGLMKLRGYADTARLDLSGYGKAEAFPLELKTLEATLSGSGNAEVYVADSLVATINGSGSLLHKGNTKKVTKKINGSGEVRRAY